MKFQEIMKMRATRALLPGKRYFEQLENRIINRIRSSLGPSWVFPLFSSFWPLQIICEALTERIWGSQDSDDESSDLLTCKHLPGVPTETIRNRVSRTRAEAQSAAAALFPGLHPGTSSMKHLKCFVHDLDQSMRIVWWISFCNNKWTLMNKWKFTEN